MAGISGFNGNPVLCIWDFYKGLLIEILISSAERLRNLIKLICIIFV